MDFVPAFRPPEHKTSQAWCLGFVGGRLLLPGGDAQRLQPTDAAAMAALAHTRHYLGRLDGADCWALTLPAPPPGWLAVGLRDAMMRLPEPLMALAGRAAQVVEWDRTHRFCGVCGRATEPLAHERARRCPGCGHTAYPRINPAMMALVWRRRGGTAELLLARSPHHPPGLYSALAGFVEPGESLEDCVHREIAEEVGVRVHALRWYGSQSWPFPHNLMLAFSAEWLAGEIVIQQDELEAAAWFALDALPPVPPLFSISGHLIRDTVAALRRGGPL